jgi:hypothetical protein
MNAHDDAMLDNVAVYALGALSAGDAEVVRSHLASCETCREEYRRLRPAAVAVGYSAEAPAEGGDGAIAPPSSLLKQRIMRQIRPNVGEMRAVRPIVWPAYAVAAACFIFALVTTIMNISLGEQVRQTQSQLAQMEAHGERLTRDFALQRLALDDLISPDSQRYPLPNGGGEVVKHRDRLYITMNELPPPPKGKVYQAWTLRAGAKRMSPSVTFVPNSSGVAVVPIPADGSSIIAVGVSVEPDGGSKQPTSKPTFVLKLT